MVKTFVVRTAVIGMLGLVAGSTTRGDEEKIPFDKLPVAVQKAAKMRFPKAEIKGAVKEVEDGKTTYEVMLKQGGHNIDVSLKPDGTVLAIEKEIAANDLPKAVSDAVKAKYPKAKVTKAEEITEGSKISFEVVLEVEGKKPFELVLSPEGKIIEDEGAEAKDKPQEKDKD